MEKQGFQMDGTYREWLRRPILTEVNIMYFFAVVSLVLKASIQSLAKHALPTAMHLPMELVLTAAYYILILCLPVTRYAKNHPGAALGMRFKRVSVAHMVLAVLAAVVGVLLTSDVGTLWILCIQSIGGRIPASTPALVQLPLYAQLIMMVLLPSICEEFLFRGALLSAWERYGTRYGIVVSALLFTMLHGSIVGLPTQFIAGLTMGVLVVASDSIIPAMIYHGLNNALQWMFSGATGTGDMMVWDLLGGVSGVILTIIRAVALGAMLSGLMGISWYLGKRTVKPKPKPEQAPPLPAWSLVVLSAAIVTCLSMYVINLLALFGVSS